MAADKYKQAQEDEERLLQEAYATMMLADSNGTTLQNMNMTTLKALIQSEINNSKETIKAEAIEKAKSELQEELSKLKLNSNYSISEQVVGTWINGKPIYRKVVPVTLPSGTNATSTAHGISNMDILVNYSLNWYDTIDGTWYDRFRLWEESYGVALEMSIDGTNINIFANKTNPVDWTSRTSKAYATLEYTKTTDTATINE